MKCLSCFEKVEIVNICSNCGYGWCCCMCSYCYICDNYSNNTTEFSDTTKIKNCNCKNGVKKNV